MRNRIATMVESYWNDRIPALQKLAAEAVRQAENLIVLENYYRDARKNEAVLGHSFGAFASGAFDVRSLSGVLQQGYESRAMDRKRLERVKRIHDEASKARAMLRESPPRPRFLESTEANEAILESFEAHLAGLTPLFSLARQARLEARGKYDPATHDAFFQGFNWRQLDNAEMELCPPFVVFAERRQDGADLGQLLALLTCGKPVKVVLSRRTLSSGMAETGRAAALRSGSDIDLLFLSLRNTFTAQLSASASSLAPVLHRGLASPRPALYSLLDFADGEQARLREERALRSRAFPHFVYDPESAPDFVSCLDLGANPELTQTWARPPREAGAGDPEMVHGDIPYTFADFALGEPEFAAQFSPLPGVAGPERVLTVAEFLELSPPQRLGITPVVIKGQGTAPSTRWVPSPAMIAETADKMHLWRTLQELGGIHNPFVEKAQSLADKALAAERERLNLEHQRQIEEQGRELEERAVSQAMRNLALRLTGLAEIPAQGVPAPLPGSPAVSPTNPTAAPAKMPASPAPQPKPAVSPVSDKPWIDVAACTSCDECITLNKKIFAYKPDKKAFIADARGGPYRDIVRAAEKCSSGAIHPGLPLEPGEKDLEKWIERAKKYQ